MRKTRGIPMYPTGGSVGQPVPVEVEGGEVAQTPDGETLEYEGPSHENGGIPTVLPEDTEIYSKRISVDGKNMAKRKQSRERKKDRLGKIIMEDPSNQLSRNTARRTMAKMVQEEEQDKLIQQAVAPYINSNSKNRVRLSSKQIGNLRNSTPPPQSPPPQANGMPQYFAGIASLAAMGAQGMTADSAQTALSGVGSGPSTSGFNAVPWGQLASGLGAIATQLAHGSYDKVKNPLLEETASLRPYAPGGNVDYNPLSDPTYDALSTVIMNRNRGKNFVDRAYNNLNAPTIPDPDEFGQYRSHYMAYDVPNQGSPRVYPTVVQDNSMGLRQLGEDEAWDYADRTGEYATVPSARMADYLSNKGYKRATGIPTYAGGGGLSRDEDYGSEKKPYPSVSKGDFAGGGRSYPIPTKADAVDALRLAGLHGRSDVRAKVLAKYPELKKAAGGEVEDMGFGFNMGLNLFAGGGSLDPGFIINPGMVNPDQGFYLPMGSYLQDDADLVQFKSGGKAHWIQKAVNPKHKGYCTPMTKSTCTPRRKALARTFKKHHGFHAAGGTVENPAELAGWLSNFDMTSFGHR